MCSACAIHLPSSFTV
ncbi:hypothetical protein LINPERPRIM_LOCUS17873 [Linum perenne]